MKIMSILRKLKMKERGQVAIEFMVLFGFVLASFVVFFLIIQNSAEDRAEEAQNAEIRELALVVKDEIALAFRSPDGYYREFELPLYDNGEYNITIQENLVFVVSGDEDHAISMSVQDIEGQILKYQNVIRKEDGTIKLNA